MEEPGPRGSPLTMTTDPAEPQKPRGVGGCLASLSVSLSWSCLSDVLSSRENVTVRTFKSSYPQPSSPEQSFRASGWYQKGECDQGGAELPPGPEATSKGGPSTICSALSSLASARARVGTRDGGLWESAWRLADTGQSLRLHPRTGPAWRKQRRSGWRGPRS